MKLCIDCADEIPDERVRLFQGTMRCVTCQELHETEKYIRKISNKETSHKEFNKSESNSKQKKLPTKIPIFYTCQLCNYKKNQFLDRPCAWCGESGGVKSNLKNTNKSYDSAKNIDETDKNIYFKSLGGVGFISCNVCEFSSSITSFSHGEFAGKKYSVTGYQCEACGKLTSKHKSSPFVEVSLNNKELPLNKLPNDERPARIAYLLTQITICEIGMEKNPRDKWLNSWQPTINSCNKELQTVDASEVERVRKMLKEASETYKSTLFCDCGGKLQRDAPIYCPMCKSHNIKYRMQAIT